MRRYNIKELKKQNIDALKTLCNNLRQDIINCSLKNGGHIASSLGAVELIVALHYVFDSPKDSFIFDVGHQAYAHKLLTGRFLDKLRKKGGISGFIKPGESPHDLLTTGHAGVAISQALSLAISKKDNFSFAIVGDGALTAGVAYEALNHAGELAPKNLVVIFNDNSMSISKNVGAISRFLTATVFNNNYFLRVRQELRKILRSINLESLVAKIKRTTLQLVSPEKSPSTFFETFGFRYIGPIDGHDIEMLVSVLKSIKAGIKYNDKPIFLHVRTQKGHGYSPAENDPSTYHGISPKVKEDKEDDIPSYSQVFSQTVTNLAKKNSNIVAITAAMKEGTELRIFEKHYPARFFDVGIAEQHAIAFASGLAKGGKLPVVAIYSTFLQRAYDQVIHDLALNNLHVVVGVDRAGFVGEDGATHHGIYDIAYLRTIPNLTILSPACKKELEEAIEFAIKKHKGVIFIRYPRAKAWMYNLSFSFKKYKLVKEFGIDNKKYVAIFAVGSMVQELFDYINELEKKNAKTLFPIKLYNASTIKPIDIKTIEKEVNNALFVATVEEHSLMGGFGSAVKESIKDCNKIYTFGIPDSFYEHATQDEQREQAKIDPKTIFLRLRRLYAELYRKHNNK